MVKEEKRNNDFAVVGRRRSVEEKEMVVVVVAEAKWERRAGAKANEWEGKERTYTIWSN